MERKKEMNVKMKVSIIIFQIIFVMQLLGNFIPQIQAVGIGRLVTNYGIIIPIFCILQGLLQKSKEKLSSKTLEVWSQVNVIIFSMWSLIVILPEIISMIKS
jgi:hypothetical protein